LTSPTRTSASTSVMFSGDCNAASHGRAKWSIAYVRSSVDSVHRLKAVHLISWQYPLARIPFIAVPIEPGLTRGIISAPRVRDSPRMTGVVFPAPWPWPFVVQCCGQAWTLRHSQSHGQGGSLRRTGAPRDSWNYPAGGPKKGPCVRPVA
jgi:hypothetical protein